MASLALLAATNNPHKLRELQQILAPHRIAVQSLAEAGFTIDVEEDQSTFTGNAVKKATTIAAATSRAGLADDSGLEVFALGGEPGVYSARYAGEPGNSQANIRKLLRRLEGVADRRARFVCVIAVAVPTGLLGTAEGEIRGTIIDTPRGTAGFGYDPIFVPDGFELTFAQLPAALKNRLSHRANALQAAIAAGLFDRLTP